MFKMGWNAPKSYMLWLQNCFNRDILISVIKGNTQEISFHTVDNSGIAV